MKDDDDKKILVFLSFRFPINSYPSEFQNLLDRGMVKHMGTLPLV